MSWGAKGRRGGLAKKGAVKNGRGSLESVLFVVWAESLLLGEKRQSYAESTKGSTRTWTTGQSSSEEGGGTSIKIQTTKGRTPLKG